MEELDNLWDERLDEHGLDAVIWQENVAWGEAKAGTLIILFKEEDEARRSTDKRFRVEQRLIPNADKTEYSIVQVPPELDERGIENIWVAVTREPFVRSRIHFKFRDSDEPVWILKRY